MDSVFTSRRGVEYRDKQYHIVIPWGSVDPKSAARREEKRGFSVGLLSDQKGVGYWIDRASYNIEDEDRSSPVLIRARSALFDLDLAGEEERLIGEIDQGVERYQLSAEPFLCREEGARLHHSWIDRKNKVISLPKEQTFRYPSFCPLTGELADQFDQLPIEEGGEVSWFVSSLWRRGEKRRRVSIFLCYTVVLLAVIGSALYSCFQLKEGMESDLQILPYFLGSLSFYSLPLLFEMMLWKRGMVVEERAGPSYTVHFTDQDYFDAFVSLNGVVFA